MRVMHKLSDARISVALPLLMYVVLAAILPQSSTEQQQAASSLTLDAQYRPQVAGHNASGGARTETLQSVDVTEDFLALLDAGGHNFSAPQRHGIPPYTNCTAVQWCARAEKLWLPGVVLCSCHTVEGEQVRPRRRVLYSLQTRFSASR